MSHVLAAVLTREPDRTRLPAGTPAPIRKLLRRCLEKDRKRRLADAADARLEIEEALTAPSGVDGAAAPHGLLPRSAWSRALTWAASTLGFAIASMLLWAPWRAEKPVDRPLARLDVDLGADVSLPARTGGGSSVAISPKPGAGRRARTSRSRSRTGTSRRP